MRRSVAGLTVLGLLLGACADGPGASGSGADGGTIVVHAAASLTDVLGDLAARFESATGATVLLNLAGSQTLATQLVEGAPGDVFIAADTDRMQAVAEAGLLDAPPTTLVTNVLAIVVAAGNPRGVQGLADLARPDLVVVLPAEEVPAGRYARDVLAVAGVSVQPMSLERSVRAALARVVQGEADASIVYATDVVAGGSAVEGVAIPVEQNVSATYPMAVLAGAAAPEVARSFGEFLGGEEARAVLRDHGFLTP